MGVFSLAGWSPRIQTGFHVSRPTQDTTIVELTYLYGTFTLCGGTFQYLPVRCPSHVVVLQPHICRNIHGLGYSLFARRY